MEFVRHDAHIACALSTYNIPVHPTTTYEGSSEPPAVVK